MDSLNLEWGNFEFLEPALKLQDRTVYFQHHQPSRFQIPFHFHPTVEVNFLRGCDMRYSFSGEEVLIKDGTCCVFWAAHPHKPLPVESDGWITNAYISLPTFLTWSLPQEFTSSLISGAVMIARSQDDVDDRIVDRWATEMANDSPEWQKLHATEIQSRLNRMALKGWDVVHHYHGKPKNHQPMGTGLIQFEKMLRFIAQNFSSSISIEDVAEEGGVTTNRALALFRKLLGRTIKSHITDLRIFHAKMLLTETDNKIVGISMDCGYASLSAFYDAFKQQTGLSPAAYRKQCRNVVITDS